MTCAEDDRLPIQALYRAQDVLSGWVRREVFAEAPDLPVSVLVTPHAGPALWIVAGIHGEEPAGPNALAGCIDVVRDLGRHVPMVVLPLCNPLGYCANTRYADGGASVGDCEHLLPDAEGLPRAPEPASWRCEALAREVLAMARHYPPRLVLDLHEDDQVSRGYVYSQGRRGPLDPVGLFVVACLRGAGVEICEAHTTRFGEEIRAGLVGDVHDGSLDELLGAPRIVVDGVLREGPAAPTVLVIETGSKGIGLADRVKGQAAVLADLPALWGLGESLP